MISRATAADKEHAPSVVLNVTSRPSMLLSSRWAASPGTQVMADAHRMGHRRYIRKHYGVARELNWQTKPNAFFKSMVVRVLHSNCE